MSHLYPAVKAVIEHKGKFLIIKQSLGDSTYGDLPGGRVDYGENPYDTLKREVMEETHLSVEVVRSLGLFWFFRRDKNQVICTTFLCKTHDISADIDKNPADDEDIIEYRWVTKEEFLDTTYNVSHDSLKELISVL